MIFCRLFLLSMLIASAAFAGADDICDKALAVDYIQAITQLAQGHVRLEEMSVEGGKRSSPKALAKALDKKRKELIKALGADAFEAAYGKIRDSLLIKGAKDQNERRSKRRKKLELENDSLIGDWIESFYLDEKIDDYKVSRDSRFVAILRTVNTFSKQIDVIDLETKKVVRELPMDHFEIKFMNISDDGKWIVVNFDFRTMKVWNVQTGDMVKEINSRNSSLSHPVILGDGESLIGETPSNGGGLVRFDIKTGQSEKLSNLAQHSIVSKDQTFVATRTVLEWIEIVSLVGKPTKKFVAADIIEEFKLSPDEKSILAITKEGMFYLWNLETGEEELSIKPEKDYGVRGATWSPDGTRVITISQNKGNSQPGLIVHRDAKTKEIVKQIETTFSMYWFTHVSTTGNGRIGLSLSRGYTLIDLENGSELMRLDCPTDRVSPTVSVSHDLEHVFIQDHTPYFKILSSPEIEDEE